MTRYFLNLTNSHGPLKDEEGIDATDLEHARLAALDNIRGVLSHETLAGKLDLRGQVDITDIDDQIVATIPFSEAVRILLPSAQPAGSAGSDPFRPDPDAGKSG